MQLKKSIIVSISILIISFLSLQSFAQAGLNFQGVARSSNNVNVASQNIMLKFSILQGSPTGLPEYVETRLTMTNAQGLFNVVIGDTGSISSIGSFSNINWKNSPKFLKIEMDISGGTNFITMGTTQLQYVAYAQYAKMVDAENINGVLPISAGGTGVSNLLSLKTALGLDKINNTEDFNKPISNSMQAALNLKANASDSSKYIRQQYLDSALQTKLTSTNIVATAITANNALTANTAIAAGTASTATKLAIPRNINGVAFDGTSDIILPISLIDAGTLTGTSLASRVSSSSLTSVGTLTNLTVTNPIVGSITGNAATATTANTATTAISATTANTANSASTANTATKLAIPRNINGVAFDGTSDIILPSEIVDAGTLTGTTLSSNVINSSLKTVGTITSGTWSGSVIDIAHGGTGLSSIGTSGQVLTSNGTGGMGWTTPSGGSGGGVVHTIGESYGGGIVFYVYDGGAHGLIASTSNLLLPNGSFLVRWYGGASINTRGRADGVGGGLKNTAIEIATQVATDGQDFAATLCNQYSVTETNNGIQTVYADWYLPSLTELRLLYAQHSVVTGGAFHPGYYWSSTELDNTNAWYVNFIDGSYYFDYKSNANVIRAIRAF